MSLSDLYQEIILDHGKNPRNFGELDPHTHEAEGFNPLCGDQIRVQVRVSDGKVDDLRFSGHGCAISTASASMMTQLDKGKSIADAVGLVDKFRREGGADSWRQVRRPGASLGPPLHDRPHSGAHPS